MSPNKATPGTRSVAHLVHRAAKLGGKFTSEGHVFIFILSAPPDLQDQFPDQYYNKAFS